MWTLAILDSDLFERKKRILTERYEKDREAMQARLDELEPKPTKPVDENTPGTKHEFSSTQINRASDEAANQASQKSTPRFEAGERIEWGDEGAPRRGRIARVISPTSYEVKAVGKARTVTVHESAGIRLPKPVQRTGPKSFGVPKSNPAHNSEIDEVRARGEKDWSEEFSETYGDSANDALERLYNENKRGEELTDRVYSGQANEAEVEEFRKLADDAGIHSTAVDNVVAFGQALKESAATHPESHGRRTAAEADTTGLEPDQLAEQTTVDENGTLRDSDGTPLFQRQPSQLGFVQEGLTQQEARQRSRLASGKEAILASEELPAVARLQDSSDPRVAIIANTLAKADRMYARTDIGEAAVAELAGALERYEYLRGNHFTVSEYLKQGALFEGAELTSNQEGMLRSFDRYRPKSEELNDLLLSYVRDVESGAKEFSGNVETPSQSAMFKRGEADTGTGWLGRRKAELDSLRIQAARDSTILKEAKVEAKTHRLKLNAAAHEAFKRLYERRQFEKTGKRELYSFTGAFNDPPLVRDLLSGLKRLGKENPQQRNQAAAQARGLKQAAETTGTAILYLDPKSLPEEFWHFMSEFEARVKNLTYRVDARQIAEDPGVKIARPKLIASGYPDRDGDVVEETIAKIATGAGEELGLGETDQVRLMRKWRDSYEEVNGKGSVKRVIRGFKQLLEDAYAEAEITRGEYPLLPEHGKAAGSLRDRGHRRGKGRGDVARAAPDSQRTPGARRNPGNSGPVFSAGELDAEPSTPKPTLQDIMRAMVEGASDKGQRAARGSVGGYFAKTSEPRKSAPKAQPIEDAEAPTAAPPPKPPALYDDAELLAAVDRALGEAKSKSYLTRVFTSAKKLPRDLQRYLIAEFTPLRLAETELIGKQRLDLAAKAELLPGASGQAGLDLLRFQTRVVAPIARIAKQFNKYLLLRRIIDRLQNDPARKKVADWTVEKAETALEALKRKTGDVDWKRIEKAAQAFQEETDATLRLRVEAGLISQEVYDAIKASNDFYAPFKVMKYMTDQMTAPPGTGRRIPHTQDLIKRITGIEDEDFQLQDFLLTAAQQIYQTRILAEKNRFMAEDFAPLADADLTGEFIRRARPTGYFRIEYKPAEEILEQLSYQRQPLASIEPRARARGNLAVCSLIQPPFDKLQ